MILNSWEPDLQTIVDRIENGDIDLQPDFQRQEVWSSTKKKRLIDTVLRAWSIPPVHLVVTHNHLLEVLDGQQRLVAIRDFFANRFSIDGNITPEDRAIRRLHGKFYKDLDSTTRRLVNQYSLRCFRITEYEPAEPSELFYRLNQPTALTAGEQRNALYGPPREQLKSLVREFEQSGNERASIGFSNARLAYDDILARLIFFLESNSFAIKGTEARISERFRNRKPFATDVNERARRSIELFSRAREKRESWRFNKASLLSWLLFFARFQTSEPEIEFMERFFDIKKNGEAQPFVDQAIAVFEDRASLRVTDVSSVMLRDVALWFSYYSTIDEEVPSSISSSLLRLICEEMERGRHPNFESVVTELIGVDQWGKLL